jgi:hypothetical protein
MLLSVLESNKKGGASATVDGTAFPYNAPRFLVTLLERNHAHLQFISNSSPIHLQFH